MSKPLPPRYRTTNWQSHNAALAQRGALLIWFDPGMQWPSAPTGKRGRSHVHIVAVRRLGQQVEVKRIVAILEERALPPIAALRDVMRDARQNNTREPCHA